jgi:hypothetical protein
MGYWWHWKGKKYLQLENEKLCFKIEVKDKSRQAAEWEEWHRILAVESAKTTLPIVRPGRRKSGTWMTVALLQCDYRQVDQNGILDMGKTLEVLRSVEAFLDTSVTATQGTETRDVLNVTALPGEAT